MQSRFLVKFPEAILSEPKRIKLRSSAHAVLAGLHVYVS